MNVRRGYFDDQRVMNFAINDCHIKWDSNDKDIQNQSIDGQCATGLKVTILPYSDICRHKCSRPSERGSGQGEYVWHLSSGSNDFKKRHVAYSDGVWFLKSNWKYKTSRDDLVGIEWLKTIYKNNSVIAIT